MAGLVLVGTHGPDDPTKAVLPFVLAAGAAKAREPIDTAVVLLGDAVDLLRPPIVEAVVPVAYPPLAELVAGARERQTPIFV